jgi:hypothetical protein
MVRLLSVGMWWCILEDSYQHSGGTCCKYLPTAKKLLLKHNLSKAEINPQLCKIQETISACYENCNELNLSWYKVTNIARHSLTLRSKEATKGYKDKASIPCWILMVSFKLWPLYPQERVSNNYWIERPADIGYGCSVKMLQNTSSTPTACHCTNWAIQALAERTKKSDLLSLVFKIHNVKSKQMVTHM